MKNLIILGSGRSGTSMTTSLFRHCAYLGERLLAATPANPFGYFESHDINDINNVLIHQLLEWPCFNRTIRNRIAHTSHRDQLAFWLAAPRRLKAIQPDSDRRKMIEQYCSHTPFCFKDPRFDLTLQAWRPFLPADTRFLVVFRAPELTVDSVLRDLQRYSPPLQATVRWIYLSWCRHYEYLLKIHSQQGDWMFLHYDQVASQEALPALSAFTEATLDAGLLDKNMSQARSSALPTGKLADRTQRIYRELLERSRLD